MRLSYLDISRACVELDWEPMTTLAEGMVDTVAFFRQQVAAEQVAVR